MVSVSLIQDKSRPDKNNLCPIKIRLYWQGNISFIPLNVSVGYYQWDGSQIVEHDRAQILNQYILNRRYAVEDALMRMEMVGSLHGKTLTEVRNQVIATVFPDMAKKRSLRGSFYTFFKSHTTRYVRSNTQKIWHNTLCLLEAFDKSLSSRNFEDITFDYLTRFRNWLLTNRNLKMNAANIHLRNIRTVFNHALDNGHSIPYPFRKFKIAFQPTRDRSMTIEDLQALFSYPCEPFHREYVDMFKLMFLLRGINISDLAYLGPISSGRIEYCRNKTGKHISVKVEPEAQEIIDRYKGKRYLLSILDRYKSHSDYLHHMNYGLKQIGKHFRNGCRWEGEALFPAISSYWARYSFASVAAELDIPREIIAFCLGHSTVDVTSIYIRNDYKVKADRACRRIFDAVFGDKGQG